MPEAEEINFVNVQRNLHESSELVSTNDSLRRERNVRENSELVSMDDRQRNENPRLDETNMNDIQEFRLRFVPEIREARQIHYSDGSEYDDSESYEPGESDADYVHNNHYEEYGLSNIDNMSYEELLALQEQIGDVDIGLSEETIMVMLNKSKYDSDIGRDKDEICCVCQESYICGEDVSILNCGHIFHFECIKPWLKQKNSCPICKETSIILP